MNVTQNLNEVKHHSGKVKTPSSTFLGFSVYEIKLFLRQPNTNKKHHNNPNAAMAQ